MLHVIRKIIVRSAVYQQICLNTSNTPWDILNTGKAIFYNVNNRHGERIKEMMKYEAESQHESLFSFIMSSDSVEKFFARRHNSI